MALIYKLFKLDPNSREGVVSATSILSVIVNLFVALMKVVVGLLASSIAIVSEGVNNATDALSSILTLVGTKLAAKAPDAKHPFGYGRIEYLTNMVIASFILVGGAEMMLNSIKLIFNPEKLNVSYVSLAVVAISAIIKYFLGVYTIKTGKRVGSQSLEAVGVDCRNDSFVSVVTIISSLVYLLGNISIDAYAGLFTSYLIVKAGYDIMKEIARITNERVQVGAGTLYALMPRFIEDGYIQLVSEEDRKKIYQLTPFGERKLEEENEKMKHMLKCWEEMQR